MKGEAQKTAELRTDVFNKNGMPTLKSDMIKSSLWDLGVKEGSGSGNLDTNDIKFHLPLAPLGATCL